MSFRSSAAHSSRIKKPTKPPSFQRNASSSSSFSSLRRRKPIPGAKSKSKSKNDGHSDDDDEEDDIFADRLDDVGLVKALATDLTLRDVAQALLYVRGRMWTSMPEQRTGMTSVKIAEVLNFRKGLPPIVTVSHIQALLDSPTTVEREVAHLVKEGVLRKFVVGGRGSMGEVLIMVRDFEGMMEKSGLDERVRERFLRLLRDFPTALKVSKNQLAEEDAKALMLAGYLTSSTPTWTSTNVFSRPGDGMRGTMTSLNSISKEASGSLAAVGGEGAVHAAGGSGGWAKGPGVGEFTLALPATGTFLKLLANARAHLLSLLSKSKFREAPESSLRQRWDGGIATDGSVGAAKHARGDLAGVLPGRTRKWKQFNGMSFDWILGECVGAGMMEVFDTRSIGRGVRAL